MMMMMLLLCVCAHLNPSIAIYFKKFALYQYIPLFYDSLLAEYLYIFF